MQEGETNLTEIDNLETNTFSSTGAVIHNETTGKQGGTTDEYYHLTSDEHTAVDNLPDFLQVEEQGATPATPASGFMRIYAKTDGKLYTVDDAGTETEIGSGGGAGGFAHYEEGTLATATNIRSWVATSDGDFGDVYITCKDTGSASSTIIDINKNGTTIFTTQANRPTLAYDDADDVASGTPDVTSYEAGDVITVDIDQVATGASGLSVNINVGGAGGSGGNPDIGARVYNSANISIPHNTNTILTFDSERWDTDTIHDTTTNTSRLTCKTAGKYIISAGVEFSADTAQQRQVKILLNGTTVIAYHSNDTSNVPTPRFAISTPYNLAVNDYVEVQVYQNSGSALNVVAASAYSPEFSIQMIAAT